MGPRRKTKAPTLPHATFDLDGRTMERGDEFTVKGEGRFSFRYVYTPDGSVTCYGPVDSKDVTTRSFAPERVGAIHRTTKARES